MPAYAECGGLMYLSQSIEWQGQKEKMVGTVPGDIVVEDRPQGRGYVVLEETAQNAWPAAPHNPGRPGVRIAAHEFHYARLRNLYEGIECAYAVIRGHGIDGHRDGLLTGNLLAGFTHQRNTVDNPWVERFVSFVREKSAYPNPAGKNSQLEVNDAGME